MADRAHGVLYLHMQKPRESEGLGRQDSSGHLTLNLLPTSTTQLLAATQTAVPGRPAAGGDRDPTCSLQSSVHAILLRPAWHETGGLAACVGLRPRARLQSCRQESIRELAAYTS